MFSPDDQDVNVDIDKNIVNNHMAGTYMPVRMVAGDKITFRVIPIATAYGKTVVTSANANLSEKDAFLVTRVLIND